MNSYRLPRRGRFCSAVFACALLAIPQISLAAASPSAPIAVDQGPHWTPTDQKDYYSQDQGSRIMPLSWIAALKQLNGDPFMAGSLDRYGYLPNPSSVPPGLPVGFTVGRENGVRTISMTCSACVSLALRTLKTHLLAMGTGVTSWPMQVHAASYRPGLRPVPSGVHSVDVVTAGDGGSTLFSAAFAPPKFARGVHSGEPREELLNLRVATVPRIATIKWPYAGCEIGNQNYTHQLTATEVSTTKNTDGPIRPSADRKPEMQYSGTGLALTEKSEGYRLTAYKDSGGVWTNGYGNTHGVVPGSTITQQQAVSDLKANIQTSVNDVNRLVTIQLTQGEFDALVDFDFNLGRGRLAASTLLSLLNAGEFTEAAAQFDRWDLGDGTVLAGLLRRRQAETAEFTGNVNSLQGVPR